PTTFQNTSSTRDATVAVSSGNLSIGVDVNRTLVPVASLATLVITSSDTSDDNITIDRSGGAIPVPVTIDGGGGSNSLTLANLTVGSSWTWDGTNGTANSSPLNTDFHLISFTAIGSVAAGGAGPNTPTGPAAS